MDDYVRADVEAVQTTLKKTIATFNAAKAKGTKPDAVVDLFDLGIQVTAPVKSATSDTTVIDTTQYTGSVAWKDSADAAVSGTFASSTIYKAIVTLTEKTGYTFEGVAANSFTYASATSVLNEANSGIVTITFPATAAEDTAGRMV